MRLPNQVPGGSPANRTQSAFHDSEVVFNRREPGNFRVGDHTAAILDSALEAGHEDTIQIQKAIRGWER